MGQVVFAPAFFQRLETFEEASGFTGPSDESAETFVVNRLFVDVAIRSTWAYASCEVLNDFVERAVAIRER
jgi:hypothetical protein